MITTTLDQAFLPVKEQLQRVTERISEVLSEPVAQNVHYLIEAGGKRLRPALVLLAGEASGTHRQALVDAAAAVELIHTATLIHDDIIDGSQLRRSQPAFHSRWGSERAVLMGDYLYATAFSLISRLKQPAVNALMADICQQLCRGELMEVEARCRLDLGEPEYLKIITDKTASLICGCCQMGALVAGNSSLDAQRMGNFGLNFGIAFQIVDDCLDLTGEIQVLGKGTLADLDKGVLSLPMIYLASSLPEAQRRDLFAPIVEAVNHPSAGQTRLCDPKHLEKIAQAAEEAGAIERARHRAGHFMELALKSLGDIPLNGLQQAYQSLAEYVILRRS
ncbi:MAG: polyprenyl synthetase family protein [Candidatus Omnitrophica bacterium]|nr:polyprenyl synthetase family protein [Candidatus Omnitrophota bacterium]